MHTDARMRALVIAGLLYAACAKPGPGERIGTWAPFPGRGALDGADLFTPTGSQIVRLPLDGGSPEVLASTPCPMLSLALTPDEVIYGDCGTDHNDGSVLAVPRQGGAVRTLATSQGRPDSVQSDGVNVYWSTTEFPSTGPASGSLRMAPLTGGNVVTLFSGQSARYHRVGAQAERIYFAQVSIAEYFGGSPVPNFIGALAGDGTVTKIADGRAVECCLTKVQGNLVWAVDGSPAEFRRTDLASGESARIRGVEGSMFWMAVDERGGFTSSSGCQVNSKEPDASPIDCWTWIRDLETGTGVAYADVSGGGVAMDDRYVYWSASGRGLYRVRR